MERVLPARRDWPLHDVEASRQAEALAAQALPPHTLMRRAGLAVAELARALQPHTKRVWICCGPGNNGGDGLEAALHLKATGWEVDVCLAGDPSRLPPDARMSFDRAREAGVRIGLPGDRFPSPDLAIDALLGLGGSRAPSGELSLLIRRLNTLACPVLAVDLPSGLGAQSGQPLGEDCVRASHTLSLLTLKPGLFTGAGRDHAGTVWLDTLGTPATPPTATLIGAAPVTGQRRHSQHKGSFGDVAVVGGARGMSGAVWLAARAAHAAGAGRVFVSPLDPEAGALDPLRPELMVRPGWWNDTPPDTLAETTVVCGCGGGNAVARALPRLLSHAARLVLDADALNALATDTTLGALLVSRHGRARETVLTPHPLEAARLLGIGTTAVQADRLAAVAELSKRWRCVVVLKGSGTLVAGPQGQASVNGSGSAALATAGTGDVLAGWLAGAWSASGLDALTAARGAVWRHGRAADLHDGGPLLAADLVDAMRRPPHP
jgi:ADP-dependent NAD(P)H-hydrate dehydratase / NAD(P)H-hydrate epimerase